MLKRENIYKGRETSWLKTNSAWYAIPDPGICPFMKCSKTGEAFKGRVSNITEC